MFIYKSDHINIPIYNPWCVSLVVYVTYLNLERMYSLIIIGAIYDGN